MGDWPVTICQVTPQVSVFYMFSKLTVNRYMITYAKQLTNLIKLYYTHIYNILPSLCSPEIKKPKQILCIDKCLKVLLIVFQTISKFTSVHIELQMSFTNNYI